jgi:hydroxycarboxylate dehydrogenase B
VDVAEHVVAAGKLTEFVGSIYRHAGVEGVEAARIARYLVSANLTGHDSHGVIRTPRYVQQFKEGLVLGGQTITIVAESPTHAVVERHYGFGQTVAPQAVDLGIAKARKNGLAAIALRHAGHIGRIGDWAERAAEAGMISIHFVNVEKGELVAPYGGVDRRFSTNPVCIGIPTAGERPMLLLDMATSLVAEGKVLVASNGGKKVPDDALISPDGTLSGDPSVLYGPLTPGGPRSAGEGKGALRAFGEHKGSGLAFMCEILAGVLTGGGTSGPIPGGKRGQIGNGMLAIYLDPASFAAKDFVAEAHTYADYVHASRPQRAAEKVLVPGEKEAMMRAHRLAHGIALQTQTWAALLATAQSVGAPAP